MHRDLDALDPRHGGDLLIAASLTPSAVLIPQILRRFCDFYPDVRVELRTLPSATVVEDVAHADADLGIAGEVRAEDAVIRTEILVDELIGIAPPGLLALDGGAVSLGELARNSLLVGSDGSSTKILSERYLARAKYRPARVWVFDSYEAIKRAVARGVGVSFVSRLLVREEIERGELIAFRVAGLEPMARPLHVVQSPFRELPAEAAAFLALLEDTVRSPSSRLRA